MTGTTAELIKAVECHRLDGAFVGGMHQSSSLYQEEIFQEELVLVSGTEFGSLSHLTRQMSQTTVLVFRAGCFYRSTLEHWFYQAGIIPGQVMELGTLDGIMSCVAAGMGITMLPRSVAESHGTRQSVHCHELPKEYAHVKTVFIRNKDSIVTPALTALLDLSHEQCAIEVGVSAPPAADMLTPTLGCIDAAESSASVH
jgi:DNA-binding transcriptional LysR family regulator